MRRMLLGMLLVAAGLIAPAPAQAAPYSVLVFSKTAGFRHDSIAAGITAIQQLGAANNFTVTATEDASAFNDANLATFAVVIWLHTTGDVLDANQQAAFERYIRAGGGYAGVHAASDTEYGWAWYGNLVGAYFASHPAIQNVTVKVEDPAHPSTSSLQPRWTRSDELYNFQSNPRSRNASRRSSSRPRGGPGADPGVRRETTGDTAGGFQNIGFIENGDYWSFSPVNLTNIDSIRFRAASPGPGGTIEVRAGSATGTLLGTATVTATGGWQTYSDFTIAITPSTSSGPLFFVVRGSGTDGLLNVNWVDFIGRGMAEVSGVTVSPASLSFGSATVGSTSAPQTVTVSNPGTGPVPISSIGVSGQYTQSNGCPVQLAAGASCTVSVRFAPTSTGPQNGTLTVNTSTVSLSGTGVSSTTNFALGKPVSASSSNGGFAASNVNDDNAGSYWESTNNVWPQWIQVDLGTPTPVGSLTLKLPPSWGTRSQTIAIQGVSGPTSYTFNPATANTVTITFTPTTLQQVRLTFTANTGWPAGQLSELQIFAGTGSTLTASPTSLNFGSVNVGSTSAPQSVTVTNTGTTAVTISSITASTQFGQSNNCGSSLAAGASCTVNVTFTPTTPGGKSGTLTIGSLAVSLSGTGTTPTESNLALNKPATATHVQNFVPANAVDGNASSYWESQNNAFPQTFTVDLGAPATVTSLVLKLPAGWGTRSQTIAVQGVSGPTSYTFNPATGNTVTITFPATVMQQVRLTFTVNTGWPAAQLSELQVMGTV